MSYHIEYLSQPHDRTASSKGNGGKRGRIDGHNAKYNDLGVFFVCGIGCYRYPNCFTCPFGDCKFQSGSETLDLGFISNRGDGIKIGGL